METYYGVIGGERGSHRRDEVANCREADKGKVCWAARVMGLRLCAFPHFLPHLTRSRAARKLNCSLVWRRVPGEAAGVDSS